MAASPVRTVAPIVYADDLVQDIRTAMFSERPLPTIESKEKLLKTVSSMELYLHNGYTSVFWAPAIAYLRKQPDLIFAWLDKRPAEIQQSLAKLGRLDCYNQILTTQTIAQILLQRCGGTYNAPTRATQQIVCDMWNTFKTESKTCPYQPLSYTTDCQPPILVWSNDGGGAQCRFRHGVSSNASAELSIPIVYLPSGYSNGGVIGLTALGHEVAHAILETEREGVIRLSQEMGRVTAEKGIAPNWQYEDRPEVFLPRTSEMVADVMDVLYFGPTAAIGQLLTFRVLRAEGKLSNRAHKTGPHPSDIQRGLVMLRVIQRLEISQDIKDFWKRKIVGVIYEDYKQEEIGLTFKEAYEEAKIVADVLLDTPIIGEKSLFQIHAWGQSDEAYVEHLQGLKASSYFTDPTYRSAHLLAAAVQKLTNGGIQGFGSFTARIEFQDLQSKLIEEKERQKFWGTCETCDLSDPRPPVPPKEVKAEAGAAEGTREWTTGEKVGAVAVVALGTVAVVGLLSALLDGPKKGRRRL